MAALRMIVLSLLLILSAAIQAQALECYECDDCESGYENKVITCQAPDAGGNTTEGETTTSSTGNETITEVIPVDPETTTSSTGSDTTTAVIPVDPETTTSSTGNEPPTEVIPVDPETTTSSTGNETTTEVIPVDPETSKNTTGNESTTDAINVDPETTTNNIEIPNNTESGGETVQARVRRYARDFRANTTQARCAVTSYEVSGTTKVKRGCSYGEGVADATRCRNLVGGTYNGTIGRCNICDADKCNSATKSALAFVPFLVGIIINYL